MKCIKLNPVMLLRSLRTIGSRAVFRLEEKTFVSSTRENFHQSLNFKINPFLRMISSHHRTSFGENNDL
jgi:hypothetical protein